MAQLPLPLTLPESFSLENFFVSDCNKEAYETVINPKNWQGHALYLRGDKSSGKSHLAYIWSKKRSAVILSASDFKPSDIQGNCVVEDIEYSVDEEALFHLFNHIKNIGAKLLITSSLPPASLPFKLPDLTSRLRACQVAALYPADDLLIANVLRKQFSDRQLLVDDEVVNYIAARCERTLAGVKEIVENIDREAMTQQKNITIPFVRRVVSF